MHLLKTLVCAFLTFNILSSSAQIQKGNYSLGGEFGLSGNLQQSEFYRTIDGKALINPSIGEFITDKWFLSVRPTAQINLAEYSFKNSGTTFPSASSTSHSEGLGLDIGTRYYFATVKNAHFFGSANVALGKNWNTYSNFNSDPSTFSSRSFNYGAGVGVNVFLNPEVAFETTLSYSKIDISLDRANLPAFSQDFNYAVWGLNLQFNNFIDFSRRKERKDAPQYVKKGRKILGGQASLLSYRSDRPVETIYSFSPQFSQFVTNNILFKGRFSLVGDIDNGGNRATKTSVEARYYVPIGKRFFMYPELNVSFLTGNNGAFIVNTFSETPPNTWVTGLGLGGSYFLSENVAIDASFFQANGYFSSKSIPSFRGLLGVGNVGLLYFIR